MEQAQVSENKSTYDVLLEQAEEKRIAHRRRVLKAGVILFNNGYASYDCKIKNLSAHGAMLEMGETTGVPSEFRFRMGGEGSAVAARQIWRTDTRIGILFPQS